MSVRSFVEKGSLRALARALLVWMLAALILCFLTACVIRAHGIGSENFSYLSAGLSFLCAMAAGVVGGRGEGRLGAALLCAVFLCVLLLTVGFLAGGGALDPSQVLSVVSFTAAGCLAGSLLFGGKGGGKNRSSFQKKKKQNGK